MSGRAAIGGASDRSTMIASLSLILLCQLIGEAVVRSVALPLPGPVLGLALLLGLLLLRDRSKWLAIGPLVRDPTSAKDGVEDVSRVLLANLSLLFVPAGVGVVQRLDIIAAHGLAIAAVLLLSVVITLLATVAVFVATSRWLARGRAKP